MSSQGAGMERALAALTSGRSAPAVLQRALDEALAARGWRGAAVRAGRLRVRAGSPFELPHFAGEARGPGGHVVCLQAGPGQVAALLEGPPAPVDREALGVLATAVALFLEADAARRRASRVARDSRRQSEENARLLASLSERQRLFERLARIQRSISHRAPLQEVLDAICLGVHELIGDEVAGVRLLDPADPRWLVVASAVGLDEELDRRVRRTRVGEGAGGRAVSENCLVVVYDYDRQPNVVGALAASGLKAAMAAPVHEHGKPVGSLVVATYRPGRRYSDTEQEALLAFAEHASIALTDAKTVSELREAQRVKEMFLAMVSHELKTPLTAIVGTLRTFQRHDASLRGELREAMLEGALERARQLTHLINRLLIGARAELATSERKVTLVELVEGALQGFDRSHPVAVGRIPDVEVRVDDGAVQGALGILVENAIAHSPPGSPIEVVTGLQGAEAWVSVTNCGALPRDVDPATLFRPFQRGPDASSPGVGLGLYIASRLAASVGGRIEVDSGEGRVTFTLVFPARLEAASPVRAR